jgi:hypothetical protein
MRKTLAILALAALAAATLVGPANVASAGKKKKSGPLVVGTDPVGDWGTNAPAPPPPEAADPLGQDLVGATIGMGDAGIINFVIEVNSLPPSGGMPEITRYTWDFTINGEQRELDGKFTNYSRGTCDPTSGQCPPPRDPGMQPFLLRGECTQTATPATTLTLCEELAKIQGIFDSGAGTITIPVPMEALGAKPGSKITGALGTFSATISAAPAAFLTYGSFPMDGLITTKTFVVPK